MQKHLFIIDPLNSLNMAFDSSLRLAAAIAQHGAAVYACQIEQISWRSHQGVAMAGAARLHFADTLANTKLGTAEKIPLNEFSAIHMRKDPPFDINYLTATWLLDSVADKTLVFNRPSALRDLNEKLATLLYPDESSDAMVSSDPETLLDFIDSYCNGDAVIKPLTLFGGRGVQRLRHNGSALERRQLLTTLTQETNGGKDLRIVQAFDQRIFAGEVRCFAFGGKPLAWCLKRPAHGNFLANTGAGATLESYEPSAHELQRASKVASNLLRRGVYVVGFDMIGGMISEINITSPRLLSAPGDDTDYYEMFANQVIATASQHLRLGHDRETIKVSKRE